jgi:hypothetical protein
LRRRASTVAKLARESKGAGNFSRIAPASSINKKPLLNFTGNSFSAASTDADMGVKRSGMRSTT